MAEPGKYVYEYPRPMVTVDALLFSEYSGERKFLAVRRGMEPFKGAWALPGGFVEMDEPLDCAAARELAEETGIEGVALQQFHTFGDPGRDPRGRSICVVHWALLDGPPPEPVAGDDAAHAEWLPVDPLPVMAFDHDEILKYAIKKLFAD